MVACWSVYGDFSPTLYNRTSSCLLRERIHEIGCEIGITSRELLEIHLLLAGKLSEPDWTLIDWQSFEKASHIGENSKARRCSKFLHLHRAKHPVPPASQNSMVNLSGKQLDDAVY